MVSVKFSILFCSGIKGISLNDIMDKSKFIRDQRDYVLCAIRRIQASFKPEYTPPELAYSNKLVETLNEHIYSIDMAPEEMVSLRHVILLPVCILISMLNHLFS